MSTHDYNISNASGASVRSDLNNALAAILSNNSNGSSPSTTVAYSVWADTTAAKLKIRNSANDAWVDLINLDGTIARDIKLTGASANINFDQSDNALEFNDNAKAVFGSGEDLTISHDGSNSIINDAGTGELQLQRGGSTVVALSSTGADLTGDLTASGKFIASSSSSGDYIRVYASSGTGKWDIYGSGANLRIGDNDSAGIFQVDSSVQFGDGGGFDMNINGTRHQFSIGGSEKMRLTSDGKLGIGTTSPDEELVISSATPAVKLEDTDEANSYLSISAASSQMFFSANGASSHGQFVFRSGSGGTFTERARINASGDLGVGSASPNSRLTVVSDSTSSSNFAFTVYNSAPTLLLYLQDDGELSTGSASGSPYNKTTSSSANVLVNSSGVLKRSTSSERYKKDITDATWGLADVLKLQAVTFKSNATGADADDKTYAGFTAEAVHALGLTEFVEYNESNEPDALNYANMVALMAKAIQELSVKVTALEAA